MTDLTELLKQAAKIKMTPEMREEQRRSWVRGELGMLYPDLSHEEVRRRVDRALDGGKDT